MRLQRSQFWQGNGLVDRGLGYDRLVRRQSTAGVVVINAELVYPLQPGGIVGVQRDDLFPPATNAPIWLPSLV